MNDRDIKKYLLVLLSFVFHESILSSPISHVTKGSVNRQTLYLIARAQQRSTNDFTRVQRRNFASGAEAIAIGTLVSKVGAAFASALPCFALFGGTCYTLKKFYEAFGRAPTAEEMALGALEEDAETVLRLRQKANEIARKTGESANKIYDRLLYEEEYRRILESDKAMRAYENDLRELKLKERAQRHVVEDKHLAFERNIPKETSPVVAQQRPQAAAKQQHTGHTHPVPIPKDAGCKLPPVPAFEQPKGCGTTNPEILDSGCKIPLPEQPKSTSICEIPIAQPTLDTGCKIPIAEQPKTTFLENSLQEQKNSVLPEAKISSDIHQGNEAILKDGYYEVNGFKFSEYYYNKLWNNGREAPSLTTKMILQEGKLIGADEKIGFFRYETSDWELIYNPITKEIWHLQQLKKNK